ncbi:MAG: hypothetical protein AAGD96_35640 [Chloroflexota bacterium]
MKGESWQDLVPTFDSASFHLGVTSAFAEVVAAGVKKLALSHPYSQRQMEAVLEPTKIIAAEHGILMMVENDLLVTPLFSADIAKDKFVILLAQNEAVLNEYKSLKLSDKSPNELAWAFGRLLSYESVFKNS